jgi:hypothetical protein
VRRGAVLRPYVNPYDSAQRRKRYADSHLEARDGRLTWVQASASWDTGSSRLGTVAEAEHLKVVEQPIYASDEDWYVTGRTADSLTIGAYTSSGDGYWEHYLGNFGGREVWVQVAEPDAHQGSFYYWIGSMYVEFLTCRRLRRCCTTLRWVTSSGCCSRRGTSTGRT